MLLKLDPDPNNFIILIAKTKKYEKIPMRPPTYPSKWTTTQHLLE